MKTKNTISTILLSCLVAIVFTACGGGGGSTQETLTSTSTSTSTSNIYSSGIVGMFIDFPVSGLEYRCDSTTKKTDSKGLFNCQNTPIEFFLGNLRLGSIEKMTDDYLVFPQDIVGQPRSAALHPKVTKMAILLQSLDSDENPSNGIDIKQETIDALNQTITQNTNLDNLSIEDLKNKINSIINNDQQNKLRLVSTQEAQDHMLISISKTYESPIQP